MLINDTSLEKREIGRTGTRIVFFGSRVRAKILFPGGGRDRFAALAERRRVPASGRGRRVEKWIDAKGMLRDGAELSYAPSLKFTPKGFGTSTSTGRGHLTATETTNELCDAIVLALVWHSAVDKGLVPYQ